jgi:hypothetical protein
MYNIHIHAGGEGAWERCYEACSKHHRRACGWSIWERERGRGSTQKQPGRYAPSKAACTLRFRFCVATADAAAADAAAVVAAAAAGAVADVDVAVAPPARTLAALDGGPPADDGALVTLIVVVSQWSCAGVGLVPPSLRQALCKPALWAPADLRIRARVSSRPDRQKRDGRRWRGPALSLRMPTAARPGGDGSPARCGRACRVRKASRYGDYGRPDSADCFLLPGDGLVHSSTSVGQPGLRAARCCCSTTSTRLVEHTALMWSREPRPSALQPHDARSSAALVLRPTTVLGADVARSARTCTVEYMSMLRAQPRGSIGPYAALCGTLRHSAALCAPLHRESHQPPHSRSHAASRQPVLVQYCPPVMVAARRPDWLASEPLRMTCVGGCRHDRRVHPHSRRLSLCHHPRDHPPPFS